MIFFRLLILSLFCFATLFAKGDVPKSDRDSLDLLINTLVKKEQKSSPVLKNIEIWGSDNSIRVVLQTSEAVKFKYNLLPGKEKDRVYIDLYGVKELALKMPDASQNSFLKDVRIGTRKEGLRVVLDTGRVDQYNVMVMGEPFRIVIDYFGKKIKKKKVVVKKQPVMKSVKKVKPSKSPGKSVAKKDSDSSIIAAKKKAPVNKQPFTLVIDPGHGGKDPGAVSKRVYEKNLVFKLAKIIKKRAEKYKDLKVVLTRSNDKFLRLEKRAVIANRHDGDLFISLHANACRDRCAEGVEIYHLDNRKNEYTDRLARVENKITNKNSPLNTILVGMTMSFFIKDSLTFAKVIGKKMERSIKPFNVKMRDYRKGALFYVLVGARMPSLLVEIGFISNPKERKLMQQKKYLEALADSMIEGVLKLKSKHKLVKSSY